MKLRFITPATTAHVRQSTARTITIARKAGSLSFSAALVRELGLLPTGAGATLTEDADAPGSWYALFGSKEPAHDCRPLRGKSAEKDRKGASQGLNFINTPLARAVLDSYQVPADTNRLVLQVLPEPVKFEGLVLWPLRAGNEPATAPAKECVPAQAPTPTPEPIPTTAPEPLKKPTPAAAPIAPPVKAPAPKLALPDFSDAEPNPRRISNVYVAGLATLKGRYRYLLAKADMSGEEAKELAAVERRLRKELGY